ncbi:MAG: DNA polymerase IV [Neptuniibacter sp.]
MNRKIIHCDCDCFFAAVEMRDNPALAAIPMAVGGSADRRGVIATCNYQAREYGVHSAMSTAHAYRLCPDLKVISGNMSKYKEVSRQIVQIFRDYTDVIEPLSLDEAFLDVSGTELCQGSATLIAEEIRSRVRQEVGITISAGVAPNKFLAKIASDWKKPDGLFVIKPSEVDAFLISLPVRKISGVGAKTAERLQQYGVTTCEDLQRKPLSQLIDYFGKFGQRLYELARGIDDRPVRVSRQRKSVSVEHTYAEDLPDLESCLEQLKVLLQELETRYKKYKHQGSITGAVVKIKFHDFVQTTAEHSVEKPELVHYRQLLIDAYTRGNRSVRLIGVGYRLKPYSKSDTEQLSLL